jgi:hypothetical protein
VTGVTGEIAINRVSGREREDNTDENEKLPGSQDLVLRDQVHKTVHPLARPDNQHRCDGHADGDPRGLR